MSSMFDVTSTMSAVATDKMQQMQDAQDQVENIGRRVDSLQVEVQESLSGIDNSIQKIEDITDNILSATRSAIQEQTIQSQLMESEAENDAMKRKETEDNGDTDQSISIIKKALEKLQIDVNTILDNYRTNRSNDVKDITSAEQGVLKTALSIVFGGSVIASLFMSSDEEPANEEKAEDAGTTETQNQPQVNSEVKEDADAPVEQMPTAEPPGDGEVEEQQATVQPLSGMTVEQIDHGMTVIDNRSQDTKQREADSTKTTASSYMDAHKKAQDTNQLVIYDGAYFYPDKTVLSPPVTMGEEPEERKEARISVNLGGGQWVEGSWTPGMDEKYPEFYNNYPEFKPKHMDMAKEPNSGNALMETNKQVEGAEDANRVKMAQNVINVVNQPAQKQEAPKQKTPVVIGKVTPEQILT